MISRPASTASCPPFSALNLQHAISTMESAHVRQGLGRTTAQSQVLILFVAMRCDAIAVVAI